jgi:hypothetical protein
MAQASRVSSTARALGETLDALADALAQARPDAAVAQDIDIDRRVRAFQAAAAEAVATGSPVADSDLAAVQRALGRCRRLGASLTLLTRRVAPTSDAPYGYGPVGQPLPLTGEGTSLTARV